MDDTSNRMHTEHSIYGAVVKFILLYWRSLFGMAARMVARYSYTAENNKRRMTFDDTGIEAVVRLTKDQTFDDGTTKRSVIDLSNIRYYGLER